MSVYIGPVAVYHRFLAGLSITREHVLTDDSLWVVEKSQRYQLARMGSLIAEDERETPATP
jgi:hypothetical protein